MQKIIRNASFCLLDFLKYVCYTFYMTKLYWAKKHGTSKDFVAFILKKYSGYDKVQFCRDSKGKPMCNIPLFFSLSHTNELFFLGVSTHNVGVDAENLSRTGNFRAIIERLSQYEKQRAQNNIVEFLKMWTMREATTKYLSIPVFSSLQRLHFAPSPFDNTICPFLDNNMIQVNIEDYIIENCHVSLCMDKNESCEEVAFVSY